MKFVGRVGWEGEAAGWGASGGKWGLKGLKFRVSSFGVGDEE